MSGLLRTILVDREKVADFVPVDIVINVMIVAAWKRGTLPAEVENNFKFPLQMEYLVFFLSSFYCKFEKNHPPGSSQEPLNLDLVHLNHK